MLLHYSTPSPFATKVRYAAKLVNIPLELVLTDTKALNDSYYEKNPLGKIPLLITDDEQAIFDSRAITRYIDRLSNGKLYPKDEQALIQAETFEALCDGLSEAALAVVYEERFRPEEKQFQPWVDRQKEKVSRTLSHLAKRTPSFVNGLNITHISLGTSLGYLNLRFGSTWSEGHDILNQWMDEFSHQMPDYEIIKPQ
jgi:glutathione S-transferase